MSLKMSVIVCSLNGATGVDRCFRALAAQTVRSSLELILVDDGSTDATSAVGHAHGATVIRHATNQGLAAARNSGLDAAKAPIAAFLDDDCEPEPQWAEQLLAGYEDGVTGVGGPIRPISRASFMLGYLQRHNPLQPQEMNLAISGKPLYRLMLYIRRQWSPPQALSRREVYSFAGANMSFLRDALLKAGRFDERFRFGGEDQDLCMRLARTFPSGSLVFVPTAWVSHHFEPSVRDTLRRSYAYGRGSARLYRKWPSVPPTFFPGPLIVLGLLIQSTRRPGAAAAAVIVPHLLSPYGMRNAIRTTSFTCLLDAYVQLAQEASGNIGFLEGLWRFRHLRPESGTETVHAMKPAEHAGSGP